jgi:hypothetical protein
MIVRISSRRASLWEKGKSPPVKDLDMSAEPITIPAVKPTPPENWVDQSDVSSDPYAAAAKLARELEADQKTIPTVPRTAEISRLKNVAK